MIRERFSEYHCGSRGVFQNVFQLRPGRVQWQRHRDSPGPPDTPLHRHPAKTGHCKKRDALFAQVVFTAEKRRRYTSRCFEEIFVSVRTFGIDDSDSRSVFAGVFDERKHAGRSYGVGGMLSMSLEPAHMAIESRPIQMFILKIISVSRSHCRVDKSGYSCCRHTSTTMPASANASSEFILAVPSASRVAVVARKTKLMAVLAVPGILIDALFLSGIVYLLGNFIVFQLHLLQHAMPWWACFLFCIPLSIPLFWLIDRVHLPGRHHGERNGRPAADVVAWV